MKLEHFEKMMKHYRESCNMVSELHDIGFNLLDGKYNLSYHLDRLFISSLDSHYTDIGVEWVNWFIFENGWGEKVWGGLVIDGKTHKRIERKYPANDEHGNPICYDIKSLWEYIEKEHKLLV